jgi:integrase
MAAGLNKLSALQVQKTKDPGYYGDGGGLWLQISKLGGKSWVFRFTRHGKAREMGLGALHTVSLAEAREKALQHRKTLLEDKDPIEERKIARLHSQFQSASAKTFAECANAYVAAHRSGWKNEKHGKQWTATLETYAFPVMGKLSISAINTPIVLSALEPIWQNKKETASRLRGRIESVLDWATVRGLREGENPARWKGHLDKLLPARNKVQKVKHLAAMPYSEIGKFMAELRKREGMSARALEFAILTAARSGEVRGATWDEIDFESRIWTIPANRMKAGKEHRVPLSEQTIRLLENITQIAGCSHIFPAPRKGQLSDMALTSVLKRMKHNDLTQHGFRSTFRDWAGETTAYPREVIEHALAHQLKDKAEAAYQRGDLLAKRSLLMADWGTYCTNLQK